MNIPIQAIMKYIMSVYKPIDVEIGQNVIGDKPQIKLHLFFDRIDDSYLKNPYSYNPVHNKEQNFKTAIRKDIELFFSIKTTGLYIKTGDLLILSAPFTVGDLTIEVSSMEPRD